LNKNILLIAGLVIGGYFLLKNVSPSDNAVNQAGQGLVMTSSPDGNSAVVPQATTNIYNYTDGKTETKYVYTEVFSGNGSSTNKVAVPAYTGKASYDTTTGIGYNSAGYGYSSATDLGSKGTGTGIKPAAQVVFETLATKKPYT
jgi:hypothetical protein